MRQYRQVSEVACEAILFFFFYLLGGKPGSLGTVAEADIAYPTVMFILLSEIMQKHAAAANGFSRYIIYHCLNAGFITFLAFLIYTTGDLQMLPVYAFARVYNIRCLFMWNIVDDAHLG